MSIQREIWALALVFAMGAIGCSDNAHGNLILQLNFQ